MVTEAVPNMVTIPVDAVVVVWAACELMCSSDGHVALQAVGEMDW